MQIVSNNLQRLKEGVKKRVLYSLTIAAGLLFVLIGVAKILPQFLQVSEAAGFLIVGGVLVLFGLVYRAGASSLNRQ